MDRVTNDDLIGEGMVRSQRCEITEHKLYLRLARATSDPHNRSVLQKIAADELKHYRLWSTVTGQEVGVDRLLYWRYVIIAKILGFTFSIKHMERNEASTKLNYSKLAANYPALAEMAREEEEHERELIAMLDEDRLKYVGSMVLGLNDALVELTGSLAGFSFALQNASLVGIVGLIMGVAAALSMAASEYMSTLHEDTEKSPVKSMFYTGTAYVMTVALLVAPYLLGFGVFESLGITLALAMTVIFLFSYYVSVAQDRPFRKRFIEMAVVSLGVAALSFLIGVGVRTFFHIEI